MAATIYYIRHGETSWNAEGRLQGTLDIPLNELGRKQAATPAMCSRDCSCGMAATSRSCLSSQARSGVRA